MNVGAATGLPASFAGIPVAQTSGSEVDRARTDSEAMRRANAADAEAEKAAGIGETDGENHQADERDADGRRPWEFGAARQHEKPGAEDEPTEQRQSRDVTGESGGELDLTG